MEFSKYIIYADESGSPILGADRQDFPISVRVFVILRKAHCIGSLVPAVQRLKFDLLGHDQLILHERDIRRQSGQFAFLQVSSDLREAFLNRINELVETADFDIAGAIIDKIRLSDRCSSPWDPYDLALTFCMERAAKVLLGKGERGGELNVVFEARGANEDRHLELEFRRISGGNVRFGNPSRPVGMFEWRPAFADKRSNSAGLQVADLAARPLGLRYLHPDRPNRAADILRPKLAFPHPKVFSQ